MSDIQSAYYSGFLASQKVLSGEDQRNKLREEILAAVHQDPLIEQKVNITVTLPEDARDAIVLLGKVKNTKSKERLKEIARQRTPENFKISDQVTTEG